MSKSKRTRSQLSPSQIQLLIPNPSGLENRGRKPNPNRSSDLHAQSVHLKQYINQYHGGKCRAFREWFEIEHSLWTIQSWAAGRILMPEHVAKQLHIETEGRLNQANLRPSLFKENKHDT